MQASSEGQFPPVFSICLGDYGGSMILGGAESVRLARGADVVQRRDRGTGERNNEETENTTRI